MTHKTELGSEKFDRWAKAVWPYAVGFFGMALIVLDAIILPPPDGLTMGAGTSCIVGFGAVKLIRLEKAASHD